MGENVKIGDKVRITTYQCGAEVGEIVIVTNVYEDGTIAYRGDVKGCDYGASRGYYEKVTDDTVDRITADIAQMAVRLAAAEREIAELKRYAPLTAVADNSPFDDGPYIAIERTQRRTRDDMAPNRLDRDAVIAQAKRDVAELALDDKHNDVRRKRSGKDGPFYLYDGAYGTYPEYVINRDKRTVVCLLRGYVGHTVLSRGIAKCDPDDCFNVHIGKTISLRRALGIEVPEEYANAPQPTKYRAGDVIRLPNGSLYTCRHDHAYIPSNELCVDDSREVAQ